MGIREEIKSYIVRSGMTMTEVVDRLYDDYEWSRSKDNFHIIQPAQKYRKEIDARIKAAGCKTRKDA